jgi:carbonic anhydrase
MGKLKYDFLLDQITTLVDYSPGIHLPKKLNDFFRYNGSLTTPKCEEAVVWTIMANPVLISMGQVDWKFVQRN